MAESPSHKWGQIIGQEFLEVAIEPILRQIADKHGLYLDTKGGRPARNGKKITWADLYGNNHDLDFVLERGGTPDIIGDPVGFIETAWRRYTKHSRNKAQEIQGAILPLATTHRRHAPFIGVILAGDFTEGAMNQLKSVGFQVLYFNYEAIAAVFQSAGIDARFGEDTPDAECTRKIKQWQKLTSAKKAQLGQRLLSANAVDVARFTNLLERAVTRQIEVIRVLPLHGIAVEVPTVEQALKCVEGYNEHNPIARPVAKYEIQIRHSNGDAINATYANKEDAITFLRSFLPAVHPVGAKSNQR